MRKLLFLALVPLTACTSIQAEPGGNACAPAALGKFAGQPANEAVGAAMLRATAKKILRWVQPGQMVTMDFSEDRLTVYVDSAGKVERASCS